MDRAQVISVNPSVKTKGELLGNYDCLARISRSLAAPRKRQVSYYKCFFNILFGINGKVNAQTSAKVLLLRVLCASLMLSAMLVPMTPEEILSMNFEPASLVVFALCVSLVFGFFTRLVALAGTGWFGYLLYNSFLVLQPDPEAGALFLLMAVFSVMGPGIYSIDQLMRLGFLAIRRSVLMHRKRNRNRSSELSYRAFAESERRVV